MKDSTQAENNIEILATTDSHLLIGLTIDQEINEKERRALEANVDIVALEEKTMPHRLVIKLRVSKDRVTKWLGTKIRKALLLRTQAMNDTNIEVTGIKKENSHLGVKITVTALYGGQTDRGLKELTMRSVPGIELEETSKLLFKEPRLSAYEGKIEIHRAELINECYKIIGIRVV